MRLSGWQFDSLNFACELWIGRAITWHDSNFNKVPQVFEDYRVAVKTFDCRFHIELLDIFTIDYTLD